MKHLFFILIFSVVALPQELPTKGDISLGGSFFLASQNTESSSVTILQFSPEFSYFVSDNLELGTTLTIQSYRHSNIGNTTIGIGPFLSVHIKTESIKPFVGLSLTYLNQNVTYSGETSRDYNENSANFFTGLLIPLNEKLAIQPLIQYSLYFSKDIDLGELTQIMFGVGFKAFL